MEAREVHVDEFGKPLTIGYDSLIVAGGASSSYFGHDQFRDASCAMKTLDDALALRGNIFGAFELAEAEPDPAARRALMTFVVVGGGPTGVEMAGPATEALAAGTPAQLPHDPSGRQPCRPGGGRSTTLVGSMSSIPVADDGLRDLTRMGVEDPPARPLVTDLSDEGVEITKQDGSTEWIPAATKIWAARLARRGVGRHRRRGRRCGDRQGRPGRGQSRLLAPRPSRGVRRGRPDGTPRPAWRGRGRHTVGRARGPHDRPARWRASRPSPSASGTSGRWP